MRTTIRTPLFAVLLLSLATACASAGNGAAGLEAPSYGDGEVEVVNDGHQDMVLYAVRDGVRFRLGRVSRMETAQFQLPHPEERSSYQVSLIAQPVGGGRAFASAPLIWHLGQSMMARVGRNAASHTFDVVLR
jgi:hypothetical protein